MEEIKGVEDIMPWPCFEDYEEPLSMIEEYLSMVACQDDAVIEGVYLIGRIISAVAVAVARLRSRHTGQQGDNATDDVPEFIHG